MNHNESTANVRRRVVAKIGEKHSSSGVLPHDETEKEILMCRDDRPARMMLHIT